METDFYDIDMELEDAEFNQQLKEQEAWEREARNKQIMENAVRRCQEATRLRAAYPLTLSQEECLSMDLKAFPASLFMDDSMQGDYSGYEIVDDPRTAKCIAEVIKALNLWHRSGKDSETWYRSRACPLCNRCEGRLIFRGTKTGFYFGSSHCHLECPCRDMWKFLKSLSKLPPILRSHRLGALCPSGQSALSTARQEAEIAFMRSHPAEGYLLLGPPGSSKSTFAAALFTKALWEACGTKRSHLWRVEGNRLLEQEQLWACANDKSEAPRDVTADDVIRAGKSGLRPVLVLEEFDKRRLTEFGANIYFRLIDAMDQWNGQLIVTTNLDMLGLEKMLNTKEIESTGPAILRRLLKLNVRDFFKP